MILIVIAAFIVAVAATASCIWFATMQAKEKEWFPAIMFYVLGLVLALFVAGMFLIVLEKGM